MILFIFIHNLTAKGWTRDHGNLSVLRYYDNMFFSFNVSKTAAFLSFCGLVAICIDSRMKSYFLKGETF